VRELPERTSNDQSEIESNPGAVPAPQGDGGPGIWAWRSRTAWAASEPPEASHAGSPPATEGPGARAASPRPRRGCTTPEGPCSASCAQDTPASEGPGNRPGAFGLPFPCASVPSALLDAFLGPWDVTSATIPTP
jgi:hypothetical protein